MKNNTGLVVGRAHKLCDWLSNLKPDEHGNLSGLVLAKEIEKSQKWFIGDWQDFPSVKNSFSETIPLQLPAERMLIEFEMVSQRGNVGVGYVFCIDRGNEIVNTAIFMSVKDNFQYYGALELSSNESGWAGRIIEKVIDEDEAVLIGWNILLDVLSTTNCINVESRDNIPPEKLNKKRIENGKCPMFIYKTLHLKSNGNKSDDGDSFSNDRRCGVKLHFRRGHRRRISGNRSIWVQPHMVGDKKFGVIEKVYQIDHPAQL